MQDYYALLGVARTATEEEIRRAYRDLVAEAMDDQPLFEQLSRAFETLKDAHRRSAYDDRLMKGTPLDDERLPQSPGGATMAMPTHATHSATRMGSTMAMPATWNPPDAGVAAKTASVFQLPTVCPASLSPCPLKAGQVIPDEGFCPECGLLLGSAIGNSPVLKDRPLPFLVDTNGREWPLKNGENLVGREGADILLPDRSVSRRHALFLVDEKTNRVTLEDLGSTNGSRRGAEVLTANQVITLADGNELRFGAIRLTIRIPALPLLAIAPAPGDKGAPALAPKPLVALPSFSGETVPVSPAVRLVGKGTNTLTFTLDTNKEETTVGRRPENTLMITTDPYISSKHAVILYENGRFKVMDLGSTNGTRWNGRKLLPQVPQSLAEGDEIIFGQTPFTFHAPVKE